MTKKLILLLVCCLSLGLLPGMCSAQDEVYPITQTELNRLDQIFDQLNSNNQQLMTELAESKTDLTQVRQKLEEYQTELVALQSQLKQLKTESTQARVNLEAAQNSLAIANASLKTYEKEVKSETRSLMLERDIGYVLVAVLAFRK